MTFLMMLSVILLSMLMTTLYSKCDQAFDLWQQLELLSFDRSNNTSAIDVKMDGPVLEEKFLRFKMLG